MNKPNLKKSPWTQIAKRLHRSFAIQPKSLQKLQGIVNMNYNGENEDLLSKIGAKLAKLKLAQTGIKELRLLIRRLAVISLSFRTCFH